MNALAVQNPRYKGDFGNKNDSVTDKGIIADNICDIIFEKGPFPAKLLWSNAYLPSLVIPPICTGSKWNLVTDKLNNYPFLDTKFNWLPVQNGGMTSDWK